MANAEQLIKTELVDHVVELAKKRLDDGRAQRAKAFIEQLYRHSPPGEFVRQRPEDLYAVAVSLLNFATERQAGKAKVRVYVPTTDEHGWHTQQTVVEVVTEDMPFLVDSVLGVLSRCHADLQLVLHPVLGVHRSEQGTLLSIDPEPNSQTSMNESVMHLHVRTQDAEQRVQLQKQLERAIVDVRVSVESFPAILKESAELAERLSKLAEAGGATGVAEAAAFLTWLNEGHFVFLGSRSLAFEMPQTGGSVRPRVATGLGILSDPSREVFEHYQPAREGEVIRILKANERSTVHRPVHLDAILVTEAKEGQVGVYRSSHLFIGLFSLAAYASNTAAIPLVRHKVERVLRASGLLPGSHDHKLLGFILETYPRDELFQISEPDLLRIAMGILYLQNRQRVALFSRRDPFGRFVSCLVYVPRDRMDTTLRLRIQSILSEAYRGSVSAFYTRLGDEPLGRVHLIVKTKPGQEPALDHDTIERKLHEAAKSWEDRFFAALVNELGEEKGTLRAHQYRDAFPSAYREAYDEAVATSDIAFVERAAENNEVTLHLYRKVEGEPHQLSLKVFIAHGVTALSDVLPMLENMGLRVIGEVPYEIRPSHVSTPIRLHDFDVVTEDHVAVSLSTVKNDFVEVFSSVFRGAMGNDGFNKLVLHAGLSARDVKLLRAYSRYLRQGLLPFSFEYFQQTLKHNREITRLLVALFTIKFEPRSDARAATLEARALEAGELREQILKQLDHVASLDEDRILRSYLEVVDATLRTNFYQKTAEGGRKDYVSFKFDAKRVPELPAPRPFREIFVFSPRVEGVHLRFGHVARGGLRWSDRQEDFRTEVLGLVKAQQVKNAVIVPVGSKGGFVVKQPPPPDAGRDAFLAEGIACYRTFISGLLDVTDNRVGDEITTPTDVVAHDEHDPYLVVAADKGTATFSDIANAVSNQYGFWLGDAFASGGSEGYDHKKMGITARGAWESVKRHFRELGRDIQREPYTCAGVGDMAGDVFGNGMLLSTQTKLLAAFNHLHIFFDPDPDPKVSSAERKRLFDLPRSAWTDYDASLISRGGGVFERKAKSIVLSPEVKLMLGVTEDSMAPNALISRILRMNVDLLFFGGIGTYVKARSESHQDVGDRANEALRVNASEVRALVLGEGANLGVTQRARIEYALGSGRCNTDFIDNSAGVDCSDHEVNIKILLSDIERAGELTRKQRNDLLAAMTDDVAALVLRDNYLQTQALSTTVHLGSRLTDRLARFMRSLERAGKLDRAIEALPDEEVLIERQKRSVGFARPELCVLLCYSKNFLYQSLLESSFPDETYLEADLNGYFPEQLQSRFPEYIAKHRLRREIIATVLTNEIVNRAGLAFVHEASEKTGLASGEVAKAYVVAREVFAVSDLWQQIEALDNHVPTSVQADLMIEVGRALTSFTVWLLRSYGLQLDIASTIQRYAPGLSEVLETLGACLPEHARQSLEERTQRYVESGVPQDLAGRVACLQLLVPLGDIVAVAWELELTVTSIGRLYFVVGDELGFAWLRQLASELPTGRAWDKQAVTAVIEDLYGTQRALVSEVGREPPGIDDPHAAIGKWAESRGPQLARSQQLLGELRASRTHDLAMLAVANRQLKALI